MAMKIVAHRGASGHAPENTVAAFDRALAIGCDALETDVQVTSDGVAVCLHDDTLDRTTNGKGAVSERAWEQVRGLDAGSWSDPRFADERVPSLETFLNRYAGRVELCVELKDQAAVALVVDALRARRLHQNLSIELSSFDRPTLLGLRRALPNLPLLYLFEQWSADAVEWATKHGCQRVGAPAAQITNASIAIARAAGLSVRAWAVSDRATVERLRGLEIDAVTLDYPEWGRR